MISKKTIKKLENMPVARRVRAMFDLVVEHYPVGSIDRNSFIEHCAYAPQKGHPGCAVGMFVSEGLAKQMDKQGVGSYMDTEEYWDEEKQEMIIDNIFQRMKVGRPRIFNDVNDDVISAMQEYHDNFKDREARYVMVKNLIDELHPE